MDSARSLLTLALPGLRCLGRAALVAAGFAALLFAAPLFAANAESSLSHVIPSERCNGLWIVPVEVANRGVLRMVLDTGAEHASVDPDALARLGVRRVAPGKAVRMRDARVGPLRVRSLRAWVHEMDHLALALGGPMDGILGMSTFEDVLLTLDYPRGVVRVGEGRLPEPDGRGVFRDLGTKHRPHLGVVTAKGTVRVLIDSGSTSGLTLRREDITAWESPPRPVGASVRYRSVEIDEAGRARDRLRFGPREIDRPVLEVVAESTRLAGHDLLRHFVWTFDRRNRRMRIEALGAPEAIVMESRRGTGIAVLPRKGVLEVLRVFPDTPAQRAGLVEGDVIAAIDGKSPAARGCWSDGESDRNPLRLTVERGERTLEVILEAEVLVP